MCNSKLKTATSEGTPMECDDSQLSITEAALTLADLAASATSKKAGIDRFSLASRSPSATCSPDQSEAEVSFLRSASDETTLMIKKTVLKHLNKPDDLVKRNTFAVERKSIKFPVKVSTRSLIVDCFLFLMKIQWINLYPNFFISANHLY